MPFTFNFSPAKLLRPLITSIDDVVLRASWQMYNDREAMKRQSTVLLSAAGSDMQLTHALLQIEQLSNELETLKLDNKEKVLVGDVSPGVHVSTR